MMDRTSPPDYRRGFNLIEAAIVLGVVGLIIGGIWFAASSYNSHYRSNKIAEDMLFIKKAIQAKGGPNFWRGTISTSWIGDALQIVPTSYTRHPTATMYNYYKPPYFGDDIYVRIQLANAGLIPAAMGYVSLVATGSKLIDTATCINVASRLQTSLLGEDSSTNTFIITAYWSTNYFTAQSSLASINTACSQNGGAGSIQIVFPT